MGLHGLFTVIPLYFNPYTGLMREEPVKVKQRMIIMSAWMACDP
jgi:hypothetical protein